MVSLLKGEVGIGLQFFISDGVVPCERMESADKNMGGLQQKAGGIPDCFLLKSLRAQLC